MLLELILLGLVAYLLLAWHRKEIEKGGEGLGAAGPILEQLENFVMQIVDIFKKKANGSTSKRGNLSDRGNNSEMHTARESPRIAPMEKFESVRQPKEKSRSKHHSRHRSKLDSALKAAQN